MLWVVLPQATRNVLPDLIGNTLEVIKLTTLASVVGFTELLNNARNAQALTYNATPVVAAALMYLVCYGRSCASCPDSSTRASLLGSLLESPRASSSPAPSLPPPAWDR